MIIWGSQSVWPLQKEQDDSTFLPLQVILNQAIRAHFYQEIVRYYSRAVICKRISEGSADTLFLFVFVFFFKYQSGGL